MSLAQTIKNSIQDRYRINFDVKSNLSRSLEEYIICPSESNDNYFVLNLTIKDDSRLTITCEPDKYGMYFVDSINTANDEQRGIFVNYWNEINKFLKVSVKINDIAINQESFLNNKDKWHKFQIRVTSPYYYDSEKQSKEEVVCNYINIVLGMVFSLLKMEFEGFEEGKEIPVIHKRYERNPINRELCLAAKGYKCAVCGFDFEKKYGAIGKNFIEVHHLKPVSTLGEGYKINPIEDLIPLCSNCHSMIHKRKNPYTPDELRKMIKDLGEK